MIEFVIHGSHDYYLDVNDTCLYLKLKLTKPTANAPANAYFFENLPIASMFSKANLYLNDTLVETTQSNYAFKGMLFSLLQFSPDVKKSHMRAWGYEEDDNERKNWMKADSFEIEFMGPLFFDFFMQPQLLIPKVDIRIQLFSNPASFFMRSAAADTITWPIEIESTLLRVKRVRVNPAILDAHAQGLMKRNAIYPITRTLMLSLPVNKDATSFSYDNLFRGYSPKCLMVAMVAEESLTDATKNPFKFENFKLNYFSILKDGVHVPHQRALTPNFEKDLYMNEYVSMNQAVQLFLQNQTNGITFADFKDKKCIFVCNLCGDYDLKNVQPQQSSNLRIEMKFATALTKNINIQLFALCVDRIEFDQELRAICTS